MSGRTRFVSLLLGCFAIAILLIWQSTRSTAALVLSPADLAATPQKDKVRVRMGGRVAADGLSYETTPSFILSFRIEDREKQGAAVPVVYHDIKPDMFAPGRDVLVDGDWKGGTFYAAHLLTQCPSKYEPSVPGSEQSQK